MRKQVALGFFLPVLLIALVVLAGFNYETGSTATPQKLQHLKEDVKRVVYPNFPFYPSMQAFIESGAEGVVLGSVLQSEPYAYFDETQTPPEPYAYTNYTVAIEDDFGNPLKGCEVGKKVTIRSPGGKARVGEHFVEVVIPGWPVLKSGDKAVFFLKRDELDGVIRIFSAGLFPIKNRMMQVDGLNLGLFPSAVGKSEKEFLSEIRAVAPLMRAKSQK